MAKGTNLFRVVLGLGGAAAAVLLSRKESRDKLKDQYNQYKKIQNHIKRMLKTLQTKLVLKLTKQFKMLKVIQKVT